MMRMIHILKTCRQSLCNLLFFFLFTEHTGKGGKKSTVFGGSSYGHENVITYLTCMPNLRLAFYIPVKSVSDRLLVSSKNKTSKCDIIGMFARRNKIKAKSFALPP
jgi:hypothetical protein